MVLWTIVKGSRGGRLLAPCDDLTKTDRRLIMYAKDAAINGRRLVTAPEGGDIHVFRVYDSYSGSFDLDTSPTTEKQKPPPWPVTVFAGCKAH